MRPSLLVWNAEAVSIGLDEISRSRGVLLAHLKYLLDEFHGVARPIDYYDLVAGIWLEGFTHNIYSAWREVLAGNVPSAGSPIPVITTPSYAQALTPDIGWHRHLRWAVAQLLQGKSAEAWAVAQESMRIESGSRKGLPRKLIRGVSAANPQILLTEPGFRCPRLSWMPVLWRWRKWIALDNMQYPISVASNMDWGWRKKRSAEPSLPPRDFAELAMILMPLYIPAALLEGFAGYRAGVLGLSLARPKVVFSANSLNSHLTFKLLLAEWRQEGTRLFYHQHGGGYGLEPKLAFEEHEIRLSDRFYSWGWRREGSSVTPLSPAMPAARKRVHGNQILLNCLDLPQVPYRLMFTPMPGTIEGMHETTCDFLRGSTNRENLTIRPYPVNYGWGAVESMRTAMPEATIDRRPTALSQYFTSRLVVHNYLGTSWLETLGLNIPTICFYDPAVYIYRAEVHPNMAALKDVGILHHSGKDAAKFVSDLGDDIDGWWNKAEVQDARRAFVECYANFSPHWAAHWEREFLGALEES